jgi:predicted nuclease of restriction endonuclease-like (RecB) superfamily
MEENKDIKMTQELRQAVADIKAAILQGQYEACKGVNRIQLAVYFGIGKYVSQHSRKGTWGMSALEVISNQLRRELPGLRGYSATSLRNMRKFYENWIMLDGNSASALAELQNADNQRDIKSASTLANNSPTAIADISSVATDERNAIDIYHTIQAPVTEHFPIEDFFRVPFTHHIRIIEGTKEIAAQYYYIHRTAEENLSEKEVIRLAKENAYGHREQITNNFRQTISDAAQMRKAVTMFKDSYMLDYINVEEIGVRDKIDVDERVVEKEIVSKVKNFIMTLGDDFTFMGNQKLLEIYGVEHFPDLLFFNRELNAMVVIELKTGEFKTSYLGQLMGYLTLLDEKVRKRHENPSIGIVLCKSANREYVEFMIRDYSKPMGVATYKTADEMPENLRKALPDMEELKKLI